jgi:hypothetical protein
MRPHFAKRLRQIGSIAALAATLLPSMVSAQPYNADQQRLCSSDAMRLCSTEIPNVELVTACMRKQKASLSDGCKAVFDKQVVSTDAPERPQR